MRIVMPSLNKEERIHIRIQESVKDDALAVASLRGLNLSNLISNLLVEAVNKEKMERPELLTDAIRKLKKQAETTIRVPVTHPANVAERTRAKSEGTSKPSQRRVARKR